MRDEAPTYLNVYGKILEEMDPKVREAIHDLPPLQWEGQSVKEDGTPRGPVRFRLMNLPPKESVT